MLFDSSIPVPQSEKGVPSLFRCDKLKGYDVDEATIDDFQHHLSSGHFTSVEFVEHCVKRIQRIDKYLKSVIELNPDALSIAAELDDERRQGKLRGSLHGIPVLVKDNIATKDKMQTTAGSLTLQGSVVPRDAHCVKLLRNAGAIILGHSNMCEWACARSTRFSSGYSARGGQTRNPYDLSKAPRGSSGGSAVAVSANIVPLALGTETDTSIIGPGSVNGIVGIKPTPGLVSRAGVIPISENFDTVGPYGRNVADAVHGLSAIAGMDQRDRFSISPLRPHDANYSRFLSSKSILDGARFGVPWKRCWELVPDDQKEVCQKIFDAIKRHGGEIFRADFPCAEDRIAVDGRCSWNLGPPEKRESTAMNVDAYNGITDYLAELEGTSIKTFEDIIAYNDEHAAAEGANPGDNPGFGSGQDAMRIIAATKGEKTETYHKALKYVRDTCREQGIDAALKQTLPNGDTIELDALLLCDRLGAGQELAAEAGYPVLNIPVGLDRTGIPIALTLQHKAWQEGTLIKWASAIEDMIVNEPDLVGRDPPRFSNYTADNIPVKDVYEY